MSTMEQGTLDGNAKKTHKQKSSDEMMKLIENSPFVSVKQEETQKYFLSLGMYRLTEPIFDSHKSVKEYVNNEANKWQLTMQLISLWIELDKKNQRTENKQ